MNEQSTGAGEGNARVDATDHGAPVRKRALTPDQRAKSEAVAAERVAAAELMSPAEVADLLGVHERTVRIKSLRQQMPRPLKLGYRTVRFRRRDVLDWIRLGCKSQKAFEAAREAERN